MFATISKLLKWSDGYKKRVYLGVLCSFLKTWCTAVPIMIGAWMINCVVNDYNKTYTVTQKDVLIAFIVIVISVIFRFLFSYWKAVLQESIGTEVSATERIKIGDVLKRVSLRYFSESNTGEILAATTNELSKLELNATKMIDAVLNGYVNLLAIICCMLGVCWPAALIAAIGALLSYLVLNSLNKYSKETSPILTKATEDLSYSILEYVKGLQVVKSYGQQGVAINNFKNACLESKTINIKINRNFAPRNGLHIFILKISAIVTIFIASILTYNNQFDFLYFIMICMFAFMMFGEIEALSDASHVLGSLDRALEKIEHIKNEKYIDTEGKDIKLQNYDIEFNKVSFAYEDRKVLNNLSFKIPQNSSTAIVGPSGSGKTTICNLISRFYDVDEGSIKIGGHDIREFTCDSLLKNISMVFQNVYLFKDSIYNNIKFAKPSATRKEIIQVAKKAKCHDFIMALPNGYDTVIGEGGSTLSGGEKQRISIARAILKDTPIIILDEATASIDSENEQFIQMAISELVKGKTVITIAHRLATIENSDQILVIDNGELSQCGTHDELIKQKGIYKEFIDIREKSEGWKI